MDNRLNMDRIHNMENRLKMDRLNMDNTDNIINKDKLDKISKMDA